ncbi:MAG: fibronectin type III domain-containing protein, partial [Gemmatimonadetes bacterium]|nr:fibronectin type III domain-containing protein [Gemmatimonadota bacterium]
EVILTLESPVRPDDDVRVSYEHGAEPLQDEAGNRAEELNRERVDNITELNVGAPGPPRSLTARADGASVIELDWREPTDPGDRDITGYRIEYSRNAGGTWRVLEEDTDDTETGYRDTGLSPGTTRHYRVAAINRRGRGEWSDVAHATTTSAPGQPTRLTATARGTSRIELDWTAPSSAEGPVTGYRIEVSATGTSRWTALEPNTESRATKYTHTDLDPGTKRYYRVAAINSAGRGVWSNVANATTDAAAPGAPTGLTAVPSGLGGRTQLLLTWMRPSADGGLAISGYRIEVSVNRITWTTLETNTGTAGTSYTHADLPPATTRHYRVAAINAEGTGPYSNVATGRTNAGAPDAPASLRARAAGPRSITLTWQVPANDNGAAITGYRIRARGPTDGGWITIRQNTGSAATTFTHTGLRPATAWRYQVAAINSVGVGPWSLEARTSTNPDVPGPPTRLTAQAVGTSRIDIGWQGPVNNGGSPVFGYRIEASNDGGRTWRIIRRNTNSPVGYYSHRNLQPAETWHYRVYGINVAGLGAASDVASATTEATLPGAPRNLAAEADGTSEIDLSWLAPASDGGAQVTGYRVEVSDNGGGSWQILVADTRSSEPAYTHTGLAPATTRHYRVSAINRIGVGSASEIASATTDATVPDPPTGLTATATSPTQIDLAWTAPAYDGGASVTGYRIEVSETGQNWGILVSDTRVTGTTYAHTGLLPGSQRFYRVSAINVAGAGDPSNVASAATDDPVERAGRLNTTVLPHVAGAMASSTVGAIADRVDAVASGMGMDRRVDMGGLSSMASSLSSPGTGLGRRERSGLATLFGGTSFQTPLGASDAPQQAGSTGQLATWGAGEYHHMGEPGASVLDWSGSMVSAHVGADTRVAADILAGVAASHSSGTFDFTDRTGASPVAGTYGTAMTSINPYVAWFPGERGNAAWGTAGFGWGDIEVEDEREDLRTSPARMMTGAAGGSYQLMESAIGGVRVKAEGWAGRVLVDGGPRIDSLTLDMQRARLALEWTQGYRSAGGNEVAMTIEGGMRYDNGDGINGAGAEVGGGVRYRNVRWGLTAEGRGRLLIAARDGYEEWGFGGMIQLDPATRGQGLQVRVAPSYGDAASGVNQLWERGVSGAVHDRALDMGANVDAEVAYGLAGFRGTPYGGFRLAESGARAFSSGLRYDLDSGLGLRIEGTRREGVLGGAEHTVGIRGRVRLR